MKKDWTKFLQNKNLMMSERLFMRRFDRNYFEMHLSLQNKRMLIQFRLAVRKYSSIYMKNKKI